MNLVELINVLRNPKIANERFSKQFPEIDVDQIDVYFISRLDVESEVRLFDAEKIPNRLEIEIDGTNYINLFPLHMVREMVLDYVASAETDLSDIEIVRRLIDYRKKDA